MSQENIDVVRAGFAAWSAGDTKAVGEMYHPDAILRAPDGWPEPGPFVGREAILRQWEQMRGTWDADALEPSSDFIDAADRVVVRHVWRGAGHGPDANIELTTVYTVRKGAVLYQEYFWDHAEALRSVGLAESALSEGSPTPEPDEWVRQGLEALGQGL